MIRLGSSEATVALGKMAAPLFLPNAILALSGDLGAGKTTFVQGLASGLGIDAPVQSPTFVLLNEYPNEYSGSLDLFHFDLYRLKSGADFLGLGFDEYFDKGGICAIEWPERIESLLPERTLFLSFSHQSQGRVVSISGAFPDNLLESLLRLWP